MFLFYRIFDIFHDFGMLILKSIFLFFTEQVYNSCIIAISSELNNNIAKLKHRNEKNINLSKFDDYFQVNY